MQYRTITVRQPWATLLACGVKKYETRSWAYRWPGPLAIHAAARMAPGDRIRTLQDPEMCKLIARCGYTSIDDLPLGAVLAIGTMVHCCRTQEVDILSHTERALGDWSRGRWAWRFEDVVRLPEPVPAKGRQGLWWCELDLAYPAGR